MSCERADWEIGFTALILSAVRFQFREAADWGIGFTDLILSAVRFQFRKAKLARVVVEHGVLEKLVLQI